MKVGILTFHRGPNYGGFLQAWCLRKALRDLGLDANLINYKNPRHFAQERFHLGFHRHVIRQYWQWARKRAFSRAYGELAEGPPALDPGLIPWRQYDVVVVGSDVVWDYQSVHYGQDATYFGCVPDARECRWVSYAPSCGAADPDGSLPEDKKEGLRKFDAISVRDEGTRRLVRNATGLDARLVVDPTWLDEEESPVPETVADPVMAVYAYQRVPPGMHRRLLAFARRHGLNVIAYGYGHPWADRSICNLSPFDWLDALRRATCIVSGSFHGVLYSVRLEKPFVTLDNDWIRNKVSQPLKMLDLENRLVRSEDDVEAILEDQWAHPRADCFLGARAAREQSWRYLRETFAQ